MVKGVIEVFYLGVDVSSSHTHVLSNRQYTCFMMKVVNTGGTGTACCCTQCRVLCDLYSFY